MKRICLGFLAMILALSILSACGQKKVLTIPDRHVPPESVPQIGGPAPVQTPQPAADLSAPGPDADSQVDLPVQSRPAVPGIGGTVRSDDTASGQTMAALSPEPRQRPKVLTRMIRKAEDQLARKEPEKAFATLEQALYIDGRDPLIWHLMARSQLAQGHFQQAVSLAKKSGSFCAGYPELKEKNADLIEQAKGNAAP